MTESSTSNESTAPTDSRLHRVTLSTPDIGCDHCVNTIQETVGKLDGVSHVSASVDTKSVDLEFDDAVISLGKIEDALREIGYPVQR